METQRNKVNEYILRRAPYFHLSFDRDGVVREANQFAASMLGEDVVGKTFEGVFVDFNHTLDLKALILNPERLHRLDVTTLTGLPQTIQCEFHPDGDRILMLGHVDVAEMQCLQRQFIKLNNELNVVTRDLQKSNAQLQKLNELKNKFLGFASHDLRNPAGVIQSYVEFLQDEAGDRLTPEQAGFLDIIHDRAVAMVHLIGDLLDIAMIESGRNDANMQVTGLAQAFRTASLSVKKNADAKQVRIDVNLDSSLPAFHMDRFKIEQAIVNLLNNAVEHSPPGATVGLSARREGEEAVISISDQGPGFSDSMRARLFQPFAKGETRKTGGHVSHGLGLAIAKRMVDAHHGRIWAESQTGHGATFSFALPILSGSETHPHTPA